MIVSGHVRNMDSVLSKLLTGYELLFTQHRRSVLLMSKTVLEQRRPRSRHAVTAYPQIQHFRFQRLKSPVICVPKGSEGLFLGW